MRNVQIERRIRWYQGPLYQALAQGRYKRAIEIAHRRWGKDEIAMMLGCELAHQRVGTYWHCLPEYAQARKALWTAVNAHTGKRRIDELFPPEIRKRTNDNEMFIEFKCGSTWQLIGSDNYDKTVGAGPVGIVYSEWALANPSAWAYHRPMLEENDGVALFITTPRGRNHAKAMYDHAVKSPQWFAEISSIDETGALTREQLDEAMAELIALYGPDIGMALYEQEYLCSFNAAILGAFYAAEMLAVRTEGRIREFDIDPDQPVHRAWDIGVQDDTSIWWFQVQGDRVRIIDCYTNHGAGVEHYADEIARRGYPEHKEARDFVPHDAKVKEWGTGRTRIESMKLCGLRPKLVANAKKLDGINAVRRTLPRCTFHPRTEEIGVSALEQYRREWDDERKTFKANEYRDWTTHLADAFRYLAMAWREIQPEPEKPEPDMRGLHVGENQVTLDEFIRANAREEGGRI